MTPKNSKLPPQKPHLVTPKTELSISEGKSTTNYLITVSIFMGLIVIVGGIIIWNLAGKFFEQSNRIKALDKQTSLLEQKKSDLELLNNGAYKDITAIRNGDKISDADLILRALPKTKDQKNLYALIEAVSNESKVKIKDISVDTVNGAATNDSTDTSGGDSTTPVAGPGETAKPQSYDFTVTVVGPYNLLIDFLANTEKSARVINFRQMTLKGDQNDVEAEIGFTTYYQGEANIQDHEEPLQ